MAAALISARTMADDGVRNEDPLALYAHAAERARVRNVDDLAQRAVDGEDLHTLRLGHHHELALGHDRDATWMVQLPDTSPWPPDEAHGLSVQPDRSRRPPANERSAHRRQGLAEGTRAHTEDLRCTHVGARGHES